MGEELDGSLTETCLFSSAGKCQLEGLIRLGVEIKISSTTEGEKVQLQKLSQDALQLCVSNFCVCLDCTGIFSKYSLGFSIFCISNVLSGDGDAAGLRTTLPAGRL